MNQTCKVCGEPAAGFHFGAFTCEGCKSFFGRSYNNLSSISECKNNSECVINKKNRTACKACRLRKCLMVGMSKSGSRYGRRSNWFKIHCLLNEQSHQNSQIQQQQSSVGGGPRLTPRDSGNHQQPPPSPFSSAGLSLLGQPFGGPLMHLPKTKEELRLLGLDDYSKTSPSVSSPESHNSDSSVEISDARRLPLGFPGLHPGLFGTAFGPHHGILFPHTFHPAFYNGLLRPSPNNNNSLMRDHNVVGVTEELQKRVFLDAVLQSQRRSPTPEVVRTASPPVATPPLPVVEQNAPIDLSMKTLSERGSSPAHSDRSGSVMTSRAGSDADEEESDDCSDRSVKRIEIRPIALDLTTKV